MNFKNLKSLRLGQKEVGEMTLDGRLVYRKGPSWPGFCFTAVEPNTSVTLGLSGYQVSNNGVDWRDAGSSISESLPNVGDRLYVRASAQKTNLSSKRWGGSGKYACSGDIMSLLDPEMTNRSLGTQAFVKMFYGNQCLVELPDMSFSSLNSNSLDGLCDGASNLAKVGKIRVANRRIPFAAMGTMMIHCNLTDVPDDFFDPEGYLEVGQWGMGGLFNDNPNLKKTPVLPDFGSIGGDMSIGAMFGDCTSLEDIYVKWKSWPASTSTMNQLFLNVAPTGRFHCPVELGTNETIERGTGRCPENWTVVNDM